METHNNFNSVRFFSYLYNEMKTEVKLNLKNFDWQLEIFPGLEQQRRSQQFIKI